MPDKPKKKTIKKIESETDKILARKDLPKLTDDQKKSIDDITNELNEYAKNPDLGINEETMMAFVKNNKWKLAENCTTKSIRDKIKTNYMALIKTIQSQKNQMEIMANMEKIDELTKNILTDALDTTFNYDKAADTPDIGPLTLQYLAQETGHFLVVEGGKVASKHSQMLLKSSLLRLLK